MSSRLIKSCTSVVSFVGKSANDFAPRACRAGVAVAGGVAIVIKLNSALKDEGGWVRAM